jgi:hypothetical protein
LGRIPCLLKYKEHLLYQESYKLPFVRAKKT